MPYLHLGFRLTLQIILLLTIGSLTSPVQKNLRFFLIITVLTSRTVFMLLPVNYDYRKYIWFHCPKNKQVLFFYYLGNVVSTVITIKNVINIGYRIQQVFYDSVHLPVNCILYWIIKAKDVGNVRAKAVLTYKPAFPKLGSRPKFRSRKVLLWAPDTLLIFYISYKRYFCSSFRSRFSVIGIYL